LILQRLEKSKLRKNHRKTGYLNTTIKREEEEKGREEKKKEKEENEEGRYITARRVILGIVKLKRRKIASQWG